MKIHSITTSKNGIQIEAEDEGQPISYFYPFQFPRTFGIHETAWARREALKTVAAIALERAVESYDNKPFESVKAGI